MAGRIIIAYLLWFFLGALSLHRFFLGCVTSGLIQVGLYFGGFALMLAGVWSHGGAEALQDRELIRSAMSPSMMLGAVMVLVWVLWWLIDAVMIPLMVMSDERKSEKSDDPAFNPQMANLDPSFSATRQAAGLQTGGTKRGIPEGYEMPWRKEKTDAQEIYKARGD